MPKNLIFRSSKSYLAPSAILAVLVLSGFSLSGPSSFLEVPMESIPGDQKYSIYDPTSDSLTPRDIIPADLPVLKIQSQPNTSVSQTPSSNVPAGDWSSSTTGGLAEDSESLQVDQEHEDDHGHEHEDHGHNRGELQIIPANTIRPIPPKPNTPSSDNPVPVLAMQGFSKASLASGSTNVPVNQTFSLTFDRLPHPLLLESLRFYPQADFTSSLQGNVLTIRPKRLHRDTSYIFGYQAGTLCPTSQNQCVPGQAKLPYSLQFTTSYRERFVYGYSVQNRELIAYIYGKNTNTGKHIMLTGGLHGSEWRSGDLSGLVNYLDNNPQEIRSQNKIFTIIPFTNPDATAANIRYNIQGVNLNLNWPAYWAPCSQCGSAPLSARENLELYNFTLAQKPTHLISYHSQWPPNGIIFLGDDYNQETQAFARWVSSYTGYPMGVYPNSTIVPGDQTVWAESVGIRSLIIEATYIPNSDWEKNFPMYLALMREF